MKALLASGSPAADPRRRADERLDFVLGCVAFAAFSGPGMMFLGLTDDPNAPPNPLLRLYWPPVYALTLLLCARRWRALKAAWPAGLLIAAPVLWAWASQAWSLTPDDTNRRGLALFMTTLFGVVLGAGFRGATLVRLIAVSSFWLAIGSALTAVAVPRFGVEQVINQGDWRGLWDTKNALAAFMMVGAVASLCAALATRGRSLFWWICLGACLLDLLMSRGKTSLVCFLLCAALAIVYDFGRRGPILAVLATWAAGAAVLFGGFLGLEAPDAFFHAIGKDPTLTGRTQLWSALMAQVAERPLGGNGFGAFWTKASIPAKVIAKQTGWPAPEAHNGWLDLLAQVGWVGAVLAGGCCLLALGFALAGRGREDAQFAPVYLIGFLALSFAESVILAANSLVWVAFVAAFVSLLHPRAALAAAAAPQRGARRTPPSSRMAAAFR